MRAHALVLLVVLGLVAPTRLLVGAQPADTVWDYGRQFERRGDFGAARQMYASIAEEDPSRAPRGLLLQARAELADGDTNAAETTLQQLLSDYPDSDQIAGAYMSLARVRRAAGDCAGALRALAAFEATPGRPAIGPYVAIQRAQCAYRMEDWPTELAAARAALSIEGGGPRLTQIEAFERAAEAELKMGRKQDALDFYNRSLELASTRAYKAEMLFTTATIARALGQDGLAAERFRAVVVDYPDQARAPAALDALVDLDKGATVSPLQAGQARQHAREYRSAVSQFDLIPPGSGDWGAGQLLRAEALIKLGQNDEARQALLDVASGDAGRAGSALLRLGQLHERDGAYAEAEASYAKMAEVAPDRAAEALFHVGFTRFVQGDTRGALLAWRSGLDTKQGEGPSTQMVRAELWYWSSKALPAGSPDWETALNQAAAAGPETFYGLRAQEQLSAVNTARQGAVLTIAHVDSQALLPRLVLTADELAERNAWLASLRTSPERAADEVSALPGTRRAETLLELGLRTEASWDIDAMIDQFARDKDLAHLNALADWLTARDLPHLALRAGRQMRDLLGLNQLPRAAQKQVYPAAWGDLVSEQATRFGVDPLLMLAMMRQESSFDARAESGAQAMGLTQVVPSTARSIAGRLGREDFALRDLFKPAVSLEFGTWLMAQLLDQYRGRVFPALTAYNAGGGNTDRWLQRFGDDPDVLVEQVPFSETQTYLRIVYDNYWHYQMLYGN